MDFSYSHIQGIDISKYLQTTNNTTKQCHYCGTEQDSSYKFCKNCGALLSNENTMEPSIDDLINDAKDYSDIFLEDDIKDNVKIVSKSDKSYSDNKNSADVKIIDETDDESISLPFYYSQKFKLTDKSLKTCPKCGSKTHNDNFCVYCGYKLNLNPKKDYKSVHCIYCGSILDEDDIYCTNCGKLVGVKSKTVEKVHKSVIIALILSLVFPGLGMLYLNEKFYGVFFIILFLITGMIYLFFNSPFIISIWIASIIVTYQSFQSIND